MALENAGQLISPRLAALFRDLDAGDTGALVRFWAEMVVNCTPIIEPPLPGDDWPLVTFVWRGAADLPNVVLIGGPGEGDFGTNRLTHHPGSDLWWRTYRVRPGTRASYHLSPGDALLRGEEATDWAARTATWQRDPLNGAPFPADGSWRSSFALPDAPSQAWADYRFATPDGAVQHRRLISTILDNDRSVFVYTPPGYATLPEPPDLLILFDGQVYLDRVPTPTILDNLIAAGEIPPTVAVLVGNADASSRNSELPCNPAFAAFLATELLPWVRKNYRVASDPAQVTIGGSSYGGLAASYAALTYPKLFGNVLSQSGSYWWRPDASPDEHEWLTAQIGPAPEPAPRFYLDVGLYEIGSVLRGGPNQIVANERFRDALWAHGYAVSYAEFAGGHDYLCWRGTLADGLLALAASRRRD